MKVHPLSAKESAELRELMAARDEVREQGGYVALRHSQAADRLEQEKRRLAGQYGFDLNCVFLSDNANYLVGKPRSPDESELRTTS